MDSYPVVSIVFGTIALIPTAQATDALRASFAQAVGKVVLKQKRKAGVGHAGGCSWNPKRRDFGSTCHLCSL